MSGVAREPVKVVIINTEYVETDARSFKSVVQKLTGKESDVVGVTRADDDRDGRGRAGLSSIDQKGKKVRLKDVDRKVGSYATGNHPVLMRDLSFKEFDRLLKEMPSVDELNRLWADY